MKIFVGYDTREDIAYQVCEYSAIKHSDNVEVIPLNQNRLRQDKWYWRELANLASTEFTFTRFLIPALTNYKGWALFCDSDVVFLNDVKELFAKHGRRINSHNKKQAMVPSNCHLLRNLKGTAPGMYFKKNKKLIVSLPGVPYEMKYLMQKLLKTPKELF